LQGAYTQRYNGRHQARGHLFQGRYKAVVVDAKDPNCLQVVSTYIHLNPARAGLLRIVRGKLSRYRWSSYPWYLSRQCPAWLRREEVLGSLGLRPGDRRRYQAYLEGRVLELGIKAGRKGLEESWKPVRRGWYLGDQGFLGRLETWLAKAAAGHQRESHGRSKREGHDTAAAERLLRAGIKALGLTPSGLKRLPKSAPEKAALAWWLRRRTTAPLRWVGERLQMGHYTRVTQAVSRMNRKPARKLRSMRETLLALEAPEPP
jgi:hypothetical protein